MQRIFIDSFLISGFKVTTNNKNELKQNSAKLPNLWKKFFTKNIFNSIENKVENSSNYGVYYNYESDVDGNYDVLAGVKILSPNKNYENIEIQSGNYLVFKKSGDIPQVVIECWQEIWQYFKNSSEKRVYKTDFEKYIDNGIEIYISILD